MNESEVEFMFSPVSTRVYLVGQILSGLASKPWQTDQIATTAVDWAIAVEEHLNTLEPVDGGPDYVGRIESLEKGLRKAEWAIRNYIVGDECLANELQRLIHGRTSCPDCGVERADYEGPSGQWLPQCPNCGSEKDPRQ